MLIVRKQSFVGSETLYGRRIVVSFQMESGNGHIGNRQERLLVGLEELKAGLPGTGHWPMSAPATYGNISISGVELNRCAMVLPSQACTASIFTS
jgi:hypothetical protein